MNLLLSSHGLEQLKSQNQSQKLQNNQKRLLMKTMRLIGSMDIEMKKQEIMYFLIVKGMLFILPLLWE
jgi:hypothetical protein